MKLYTRTGDQGETALFGGERVSKSHERVRAYGTLDEANSVCGWALSAPDIPEAIREAGISILSDLFDLGAELATPSIKQEKLAQRLDSNADNGRVLWLESLIDDASKRAPAMTTFVLPTGAEGASRFHVARTVVRRAERDICALAEQNDVRPIVIEYLNRLSDLLFAWARQINAESGHGDVAWEAKKDRHGPQKS